MHRRRSGQGLVEFALVLPLALLLLVALFDLGRVLWAANATAHAAAEAARYAIVRGGTPSNACPIGPDSGQATIPAPSADCPHPSPSRQSILDRALDAAVGAGGTLRARACYGAGCTGETDAAGATNAPGTPIRVEVEADLGLVVTALLGSGTYTVRGVAVMTVNH